MRHPCARLLAVLLLLSCGIPAFAQDAPQDERSFFLSFVENQLSTPNRRISISGIEGVLSSEATIGQITIADREGVWLRINDAAIDWNRSALLLRRLEIERLAAESIEVLRSPLPDQEGLPSPEAEPFQLPELPLAVILERLEVPSVSFSEDVFGLESRVSVEGSLRLAGGSLDAALQVARLDGPGGRLQLEARYANATGVLDLALTLSEPENGLLANLLQIEGRPPIELSLDGSGPLSDLDLTLSLDAAGERALAGAARVRRSVDGYTFSTNVEGPIATLVPQRFRDFFGQETTLSAAGLVKDAGGVRLDRFTLESGALALSGALETSGDGFLTRVSVDGRIDAPGTGSVVLPVPGGETTLDRAELTIAFGADSGETWSGTLVVDALTTATFAAERVDLKARGQASNLNSPAEREITFAVDGDVSGIVAESADVAQALGDRLVLGVEGSWTSGSPVSLPRAEIEGNAFSLSLVGSIADFAYRGEIAVAAQSIAPFSGLAGRSLTGELDLAAQGEVRPASGAFDLTLDGVATELETGTPAADSLLIGATRITGRVARGEEGLVADELRVGNEQVTFAADGRIATGAADFRFDLTLADLALLSQRASGQLTASGRAVGTDGPIDIDLEARVPSGSLAGRDLADAMLAFGGTLRQGNLDGEVSGNARLGGVAVGLSADVAVREGERRLSELELSAGAAALTGELLQTRSGLFEGELTLASTDISTAAALLLVEATGEIDARIGLQVVEDSQHAEVSANIDDLETEAVSIGAAELSAEIADLFGVPAIEGSIRARSVAAGGVNVSSLTATATRAGAVTGFDAQAALADGAEADVAGTLAPEDDGYRLTLRSARLARGGVSTRLQEPASLLVVGQDVVVDTLVLDVGGGRASAGGRIADELDLSVELENIPLDIVNLVRPDLGLSGTVDGSAQIGGTRQSPEVRFDLTGRRIGAAALSRAGVSTLAIDATGRTTADNLVLEASVTSPEGLRARAEGSVPLGDGELALEIDLAAFPLAALNPVAPGQGLGGTIAGTIRAAGSLAEPTAEFSLTGRGVSAAALAGAGIPEVQASAAGRFADGSVRLSSASVTGPAGLSVSGSGTIPLAGPDLAVDVSGSVSLALANRFLADRGAQVSGLLTFDVSVGGSIASPTVQGSFATSGAELVDPETNIRLTGVSVSARIDGQTVHIADASAALARGGRISASGTVSLDAGAAFPADIRIRLDSARYADGDLVAATLSGVLSLTGPLARDPLLSGAISVERAAITVPDSFGGPAEIDVEHVSPPPGVAATLRRARAEDGTPVPSGRPSVVRLNVTVSAPNRIFVRGRGLDAELGGNVTLTGPLTDVRPVGEFDLIRGRLSILGQRITFDEGAVTLVGDLDPFLNFVARSEGNDITVFITVRGRVSDLQISFSSQPELPEDEVLARLIFDRGLRELSPLQIAQLAAAAAELAGGANTSLLGSLRDATGLDDLDVVTDREGNAAVRAGRYIQDNVYLGVEAGAHGRTRVTIDLDITEDLKARGSLGTGGESSLGIFYERDY